MQTLYIARKLGVYRSLYRINQSFANILTQCEELREMKVLKPDAARRYQSLTQELQAEISRGLIQLIETQESRRQFRLVKAREEREQESSHGTAARRGTRGPRP